MNAGVVTPVEFAQPCSQRRQLRHKERRNKDLAVPFRLIPVKGIPFDTGMALREIDQQWLRRSRRAPCELDAAGL